MDKLVLGIYLDGLTINAALVRQDQGFFQVEALESFKLFDTLDKSESDDKKAAAADGNDHENIEFDDNDDLFGYNSDIGADQTHDVAQARGNIDVIIEMMTKMAPPGIPVAFNLLATQVNYKVIQAEAEKSKAKLKKLVWNELSEEGAGPIISQNIGLAAIDESSYLGMVHKDYLVFFTLLSEALKVGGRKFSPIILIDTIEFALAEYINRTVDLTTDDRAAVVLFSHNYTKIMFLKGHKIENVLPTIHIGARSSKICETAFSKMLYELDFKGIDSPQTIILAGEVDLVQAEPFFTERFPNLRIIKLETDDTLLGLNAKEFSGRTSSYSVAIALALKAMQPKKNRHYKENYLPKQIREKQSEFVVAWHGFAMLGIVLLTMLFLFIQTNKINSKISEHKVALNQINTELVLLKNVEHDVDSLRMEINNIEMGAALIDSLGSQTTRWMPLVETLSDAMQQVGNFSISKIETVSKQKMIVAINLSTLEQVALLERFIPGSKVLSVINQKSEETSGMLQLTIECDVTNMQPGKDKQSMVMAAQDY
ncbi:MAG: hypothetical protein SCK70_05630 [bacterium]|nr:hypothetical protein [bacterium]